MSKLDLIYDALSAAGMLGGMATGAYYNNKSPKAMAPPYTPLRNKLPPKKKKGVKRKPDVDLTTNLVTGDGGTKVLTGPAKRRRKTKKFNVLSKKQKKVVKKIVKNLPKYEKTLVANWQLNFMNQVSCALNKVGWQLVYAQTKAAILPKVQQERMLTASDGVTTLVTEDPQDVIGPGGFKKYLCKADIQHILKNNTNGSCELTVYKFRCIDDTNVTPLTDLDGRITASQFTKTTTASSTPSAPLAKEDNFWQYWSTPNQRDAHWKMVKKVKYNISPGDEVRLFHKIKTPIMLSRLVDSSYYKGQEALVFRIQGKPTHQQNLESALGMSPAQLDYLQIQKERVYAWDNSTSAGKYVTLANSGFTATTAAVVTDATIQAYDEE